MSKYEKKKPTAFTANAWITSGKRITEKHVKKNAKQNKHTIYGTRALNVQLPGMFKKQTEDWDIYANRPKRAANKLESQLDTHFKCDIVDVHPAKHKGTYRVLANVGEKEVADYTKPKRRIETVKIEGIKYQSLMDIKKERKQILKDPANRYRYRKDINVLGRIKDYKRYKK